MTSERYDLNKIARDAMVHYGLEPDFPAQALAALRTLPVTLPVLKNDLRHLLWSSIDNPDSKDLDQIEVVETLANGSTKVRVGVADVDSLVHRDSALDQHAHHNTVSVYTAGHVFPMLPERLSTDLTSLNEAADRAALVIEFTVDAAGVVNDAKVYQALVRNAAQLDYESVGAFLEQRAPAPPKVAANAALAEQLRLQDKVASVLRERRHEHGALDLASQEAKPDIVDGQVVNLHPVTQNRAHLLIEDFMIAANTALAHFADDAKIASIRRIVRTPERWLRIVSLAEEHGDKLPNTPDSVALSEFLLRQRKADPERFPDLSLTIIKLLGPGEYVVTTPDKTSPGHFGLAVDDYTHATAPNRRFADLATQRLIKAVLNQQAPPYSPVELENVAANCTERAGQARKVERLVTKAAAAMVLAHRIGEVFPALVTGVSDQGTYARLLSFPTEGRVVVGQRGLDVGHKIRVKLIATDPPRGHIDLEKI